MRHCCIIGGAGFIGSHIVKKLISRERQITVIGRNLSPSRILPGGVRYVAGDFGSKHFLDYPEILRDNSEDHVSAAQCPESLNTYP